MTACRICAVSNPAIFIMREAAAEFRNPVMLYSMGEPNAAYRAQGLPSIEAAARALVGPDVG
jgi:hypothetical protein